ncbi:reticulon-4-interacting protein 1 homolog, mitochondrial [Bombus terrestris]|uniref:Reticulon-4-interacting protein 1 homolog, mitochondrial n=1 Tax=Bombus terrestris TaxID=30195 RepID=A0A9B2JPQ3_BOMTE|nr:reticulon-4-interacting protein 1 homolog, mitochondrial [Bombus terrestris]XP_048264069.1 reticulon-4-interacting protein 1 homolog, mitochondrial [Bombus terrestris]
MDEIWFHLSNQVETLQIQTSLFAQQGQQWVITWLTQARQIFYKLYENQTMQNVKDIVQHILIWIENAWEQLQHRYYNTHFNVRVLYGQIESLYTNGASKRELAFCLTGLVVGTLLGYYAGVNWGHVSHHMHHIKAIICHHYIGIEGVSMIDDAEMPMIERSNELLVQVKAASVNVVDTKICYGYSKIYRRLLNSGKHKELPVTLGRDCTGIVIGIGQSVINFDIGDEVLLAVPSWAPGTMAEYIVVPETQVVKRPKLFTFEASASLPYNGCLAWDALVNRSAIQEGNAKGKRVLIYGGNTPVGCILTQLVKLWGGHVVTMCKQNAIPVSKALGADDVIPLDDSDVEKELQLHDKFDTIFYTGGQPINERILKQHLASYGFYVSTVPEQLTSDSLGLVFGSIFAGCVRIKLLIQYVLGFNMHQWKEGSKINATYLQALCDLVDADQLQMVVDRVYGPHNIEQALYHILDPNAIGSTIITFQ